MNPARYPLVLVFLALLMLSAPPLLSAAPPAGDQKPAAEEQPTVDVPLMGEKIRQLMQDRKYQEAVEEIDRAAQAKDAPKDYLAYLKGRALFLQKEYDRAAKVFGQLQKDFPKSGWARRGRLAGALALARKGDFRSAELIVRAEADEKLEEFETLAAWGKALQPESPDAFPEPNSDKLERDVELL